MRFHSNASFSFCQGLEGKERISSGNFLHNRWQRFQTPTSNIQHWTKKHPISNIQHPAKLQTPNSESESRVQSPKSKKETTDEEARGKAPIAVGLQRCAASVPKKAAVAWAQFVATI